MKFKRQEATALVEYNEQGFLIKYELTPGQFKDEHFKFLVKYFPTHLSKVKGWMKNFKNVEIRELEEDLSFDAFYDKYAYKISKRSVAEKIWKKMPDIEKAKAIKFIDVYDTNIRKSGINKKYPETYLNSEMWNN